MSDQPTGAHPPPADGYPVDPLAGPTAPSDALWSEPYPSAISESERQQRQSTAAPVTAPAPVPYEPAGPAAVPSAPLLSPVPPVPLLPPVPPVPPVPPTPPTPSAPSGAGAGPADGPQADAAHAGKAGKRFSPVLKRVGVALIGVVVVVLGRTAFDRGSADVLEVGQCVSRDGNEIAQVDCTDQKATYKVLLIQKDAAQSSIESVCSGAPNTTTSYFESKEGETQGNVICLSDLS